MSRQVRISSVNKQAIHTPRNKSSDENCECLDWNLTGISGDDPDYSNRGNKRDVPDDLLPYEQLNSNNSDDDDEDITTSSHNQPQTRKTPIPIAAERSQNHEVAWDQRAIRDAAPPNKKAIWFYTSYLNTEIPSIQLRDPKQTEFLHAPTVLIAANIPTPSGRFFRAPSRAQVSLNMVKCTDFVFRTTIRPKNVNPTDRFLLKDDALEIIYLYHSYKHSSTST